MLFKLSRFLLNIICFTVVLSVNTSVTQSQENDPCEEQYHLNFPPIYNELFQTAVVDEHEIYLSDIFNESKVVLAKKGFKIKTNTDRSQVEKKEETLNLKDILIGSVEHNLKSLVKGSPSLFLIISNKESSIDKASDYVDEIRSGPSDQINLEMIYTIELQRSISPSLSSKLGNLTSISIDKESEEITNLNFGKFTFELNRNNRNYISREVDPETNKQLIIINNFI